MVPSGIDEKLYQVVKPRFETTYREMMAAGKSMRDFARYIIEMYGATAKPYLLRWHEERNVVRKKQDEQNYQQVVRPYFQDMQREFQADHTMLKQLRAGVSALISVFGVRRAKSYSLRYRAESLMHEKHGKAQSETYREFFLEVHKRFDEDLMTQWMKDLPKGAKITKVYLPPLN
jgi:hypothetical protein